MLRTEPLKALAMERRNFDFMGIPFSVVESAPISQQCPCQFVTY
jgi:hypothetical protein